MLYKSIWNLLNFISWWKNQTYLVSQHNIYFEHPLLIVFRRKKNKQFIPLSTCLLKNRHLHPTNKNLHNIIIYLYTYIYAFVFVHLTNLNIFRRFKPFHINYILYKCFLKLFFDMFLVYLFFQEICFCQKMHF